MYMDKEVRSLGDGDQFLDPIYIERELKNMVGGQNVSTKAFFPAATPKKRCGPILPCGSCCTQSWYLLVGGHRQCQECFYWAIPRTVLLACALSGARTAI